MKVNFFKPPYDERWYRKKWHESQVKAEAEAEERRKNPPDPFPYQEEAICTECGVVSSKQDFCIYGPNLERKRLEGLCYSCRDQRGGVAV